ncbi:MAG: TetR/AcrR family transcriptional regulator [Saprospiraceae bacterium]|nr:TetR/AcrR family transcriptional regulator [Bacteroidia bacterium]NNK90445.1 TetR/AcrR family transcriptional regulator [Saprospiraceae bacterium]
MLTKESLLKSAKDLFYKYGIKSVSMDDLARMLGVSKKTIYTYIDNKKDLVRSVISQFIEEEKKAVEDIQQTSENAVDEMTSIARYVLKSLQSVKPALSYDLKKYHPESWRLIEHDHFNFIQKKIKKNIERGIQEGYYRESIDSRLYSFFYIGLSRSMVHPDGIAGHDYKLSEVYENIIIYHLNGIMNTKGKKAFDKYLKKINT